MFPNAQDNSGGDLEGRLRGLILSNASSTSQNAPSTSPAIPPHLRMASPAEQQEYLARASQSTTQNGALSQPSQPSQSQQPARKRLNQAQRRQLNAGFSIPINPRSQQSPLSGGENSPSVPFQGIAHHNVYQPNHAQRFHQQQQFSPQYQNQNRSPNSPYSPQVQQSSQPSHQQYARYHFQGPGQANLQNANSPSMVASPEQDSWSPRPSPRTRQLYQPGSSAQGRRGTFSYSFEETVAQCAYLESLVQENVPKVAVDSNEIAQKEAFRTLVEEACRECIAEHEQREKGNLKFDAMSVELRCFGSMSSGFATRDSDMDLALLSPHSKPEPDAPESPIPRMLEKKLLDRGFGSRLLTRTRVPIIKLCEKPAQKLMLDLLAERAKWENGFIAEQEDQEAEEEVDEGEAANHDDMSSTTSPTDGQTSPKAKRHRNQKNKSDKVEGKDEILKQDENQSLPDYYNSAKRALRVLGGRDLSATSSELNEEECKILNEVCRAFITGLASKELATRLSNYQSISPLFDRGQPFVQRSLNGIWTQIEGEQLAMAWETRPLPEGHERAEAAALELVEAWRALQEKTGPLTETNLFNKQLYTAAEKLKKINSLQLVFLQQYPLEEPLQYMMRVQRIMYDLKQGNEATVMPVIVAHYIAGINDNCIRDELEEPSRSRATLRWVNLQHRTLQLAADYEHALLKKTDLFDEADKEDIKQYIGLLHDMLHGEPNEIPSQSPALEKPALIAKIRTLPDPTQVSRNKPRDRYRDHLEFPKTEIGIQCDINFSAHLALHNTLLLRCYSYCDPRVKSMVLFIKHWAKVRCINTPYRGTLSSYGYVLMVLHYLVNVAQPFVCPNLQEIKREPPSYLPPSEIAAQTTCQGRNVQFWRNETEIRSLAERNMLNHNHDSLGLLLRGFFEFYAQSGPMTTVETRGFDWGREVLSLRTHRGILTKQEKGWIGARTVIETTNTAAPPSPPTPTSAKSSLSSPIPPSAGAGIEDKPKTTTTPKTIEEIKEVRHRYLIAIEDPFELDHNVARTVTHNGIVGIRDEFRRAWRIIRGVGRSQAQGQGQIQEGLLDVVEEKDGNGSLWKELLGFIHGDVGVGVDGKMGN